MLLAVLEKRGGFRLGSQDVFLNIAGGLKVSDPALDLAICASLVSSFEELAIPHNYAFAGEVGLGGEVRAVGRIENRIAEAEKLGFKAIFIYNFCFDFYFKISEVPNIILLIPSHRKDFFFKLRLAGGHDLGCSRNPSKTFNV